MPSRTLFALFALAAVSTIAAADRPPNVIVILSDDQGTVDVEGFGAPDLHTPHLRALGDRGVRMTQFYAGAPVCSPSRAALLTGRFPHRAGVPGNVGLEAVGLPPAQVTMAEMFKAAGYRTALTGKWHLGHVNGNGPLDQGFDFFYGHKRGCIDNFSHFFYWSGPNVHDLWRGTREISEDGVYFPDATVREAKEFILGHRDRPFFLYLAFNIPHYPMQGTAAWRQFYELPRLHRKMPENRFHYAALVSTLDEKIGETLDYVDKLGLREDTIVVFMSDHGHSTEERAMFGGGSAGPYRGAKFSLFEGGIRVPAIVSWPGRLPEGESRGQFAAAQDWLPTLAELTGAKLPEGYRIDGKSLVSVLRDPAAPTPHERFFWQVSDQWAVREGDWKLVANASDTDRSRVEGDERMFLSNLVEDSSERNNVAARHPDKVARLSELYENWAAEVGAKSGK